MNTNTTSPDALRETMIAKVKEMGYAQRPEVEQVLRDLPRHHFVPDADLDSAYNPYRAVITHRADDGASLSCASAPYVVAMMLDQLAVEPGNRILEIGAGTGYHYAALAELSGTAANVVTIDNKRAVTAEATRNLTTAGYHDIRVVTGDGAVGVPEHAPYDRIIATVSPWDIPHAWWQQLAPGGRIVLPLRWRGQARSIAFTHRPDGTLVSDSVELCGFVYLDGEDEGELDAPITRDETIRLHWDRDQDIDPTSLDGVLDQPRTAVWSGVTIAGDEPHDTVWLRLTATDPRVCRINAAADTPGEVCDPIQADRSPALAEGASLAYLSCRPHKSGETTRWELGAIGHGPNARALTSHLCDEIRAWDSDRAAKPTIAAYPADTPSEDHPDKHIIPKRHSQLALSWGQPQTQA